jgi:hypothetical protein
MRGLERKRTDDKRKTANIADTLNETSATKVRIEMGERNQVGGSTLGIIGGAVEEQMTRTKVTCMAKSRYRRRRERA